MAKLPDSSVIKELAELLDSTGLTEIEVETSGVRIKVARSGTPVATTTYVAPQQAEPETPAPASVEAPTTAPAPAEDPADHPGAVKSPMVGTAYMSSEPGAAAFIKVGDMVSEGRGQRRNLRIMARYC